MTFLSYYKHSHFLKSNNWTLNTRCYDLHFWFIFSEKYSSVPEFSTTGRRIKKKKYVKNITFENVSNEVEIKKR